MKTTVYCYDFRFDYRCSKRLHTCYNNISILHSELKILITIFYKQLILSDSLYETQKFTYKIMEIKWQFLVK